MAQLLFESRQCGSRAASRVRVRTVVWHDDGTMTVRPSRYSGQVGIVVQVYPVSGDVLVRLPSGLEWPFAKSDLEVLA